MKRKTMDAATESAFMAGVAFAREEADGWPGEPYGRIEYEGYLAWRRRWAGVPHESPGDATENPPRYCPGDPPGHYTVTTEEAREMGAFE